jgi:hypothetical protein
MRIANAIAFIFLFFANSVFAQIKVVDAGDGWNAKVDSAIQLIKDTDSLSYQILIENCKTIDYTLGNFSTTYTPHTISISTKEFKLNSINNIACVLVHESYHLYLFNHGTILDPNREEYECYLKEYEFICKLPYVESWLFQNAIDKIILYRSKLKD